MHRKLIFACVWLIVSLTAVATAVAGTVRAAADPGVTPTTILLGGTAPLSGPSSSSAAVARGAAAYFDHVNAKGGVNGRKIIYRVVDDGNIPANTIVATRRLVQEDKVFALFNSYGTATNLAVRAELNSLKVPQLFAGSGASTFGNDYTEYPYTSGFGPTYRAEGWVYGTYLARTARGATIAMLFKEDADGVDFLGGLKAGLLRSKTRLIAAQPYSATTADIGAQMAKLKSSGADTLVIFAAPAVAAQAYAYVAASGWKPKRVVNSSLASSAISMERASAQSNPKLTAGTISITYFKDPSDPRWARDPGLKLYRTILAKYAPLADAADPLHVYGMAVAWNAVDALRKAGRSLTRDSLIAVVDKLTVAGNPFLLPGIIVRTGGDDHSPLEQLMLKRWQNGAWKSFGGLWTYRAP